MVQVKDIMAVMEEFAPKHLAEHWDKTGLAIGNPESTVKKILVALDATKEVIAEAIEKKADMILTHHPMLLFQKMDSITADTPLGNKIYQLIQNDIAAFSAHTNLDIAKGGTNDVLSALIGLQNVELLEITEKEVLQKIVVYVPVSHEQVVREAMCQAGVGHIGKYACCTFATKGTGTFLPLDDTNPYLGEKGKLEFAEEIRLETIVPKQKTAVVIKAMCQAHPYEEVAFDIYTVEQTGKTEGIGRIGTLPEQIPFSTFAAILKQKLGLDSIRLTGNPHKMIKRVGLCTGSGAEFLSLAQKKGADVYLTGDMKFHEAQKAVETGICVADVTHYASEVLVIPVLQKMLQQKAEQHDWDLEVICSEVNGQTFWSL